MSDGSELGTSSPLGATPSPGGVNFSVFSRHATAVELLLFDGLEADRSRYANYSGTGNTLNANHPIVRRMILDSLRYWVEAMHVDGFRFDLAAILERDESGNVMPSPPVLWDIVSDGAGGDEAHCRGVGRGRPVPGATPRTASRSR